MDTFEGRQYLRRCRMGKEMEKVNVGRKRARFTKEFKLEAVRLLELGEKPATQLAAELGIRRNQLLKWQAQLRSKGTEKALRGPRAERPVGVSGGGTALPR